MDCHVKMKEDRKPQKSVHIHKELYYFNFAYESNFMAVYYHDGCKKRKCKNYTKDYHWYEIYLNNFVDLDTGEFLDDLFFAIINHENLHEALRYDDLDLEKQHFIIENILGSLYDEY